MLDDVTRLVEDHWTLARLELSDGLRQSSGDLGRLLGAALCGLVGYGFTCSGVAVVLAERIGTTGALFMVGGANLLVAVALGAWGTQRLKRRRWLSRTAVELDRTVSALKSSGPQPELPRG